jgi:CRISPR-associated endonuclease Csn1
MKKQKVENYFIGLDIGTDSVGYAATDASANYNLLKFGGEPIWGVTLFDTAELCDGRRAFRTARRRLDRRQQRIELLQELFAPEIAAVDKNFFCRIKASALRREDKNADDCFFNNEKFDDVSYHEKYPTIHHLIVDLMDSIKPHDARLVYLACAWLLAHRGHFLSEISEDNIEGISDFKPAFDELISYLYDFGCNYSWQKCSATEINQIGTILGSREKGVKKKYSELQSLLKGNDKFDKNKGDPENASNPFCETVIFNLLCGGTSSLAQLFGKDEYEEDFKSFKLDNDDEVFENAYERLGDDGDIIRQLKKLYDRVVLGELMNGEDSISKAKVNIYKEHQRDLAALKKFVKENFSKEIFDQIFRKYEANNYVAYSANICNCNEDDKKSFKKCKSQEDFCKYLKKLLRLSEEPYKSKIGEEIYKKIENNSFLPKQVNNENRVIPYQVYYFELKKILDNASVYLPFLNEKDSDGYVTKEKIKSIMRFRIPYYVGPLNGKSEHAWIERRAEGKIYPWNFDEKVDRDKSNEGFIKRMLNKCSYLAGEDVLPKKSLLYEKFEVLNEINNINIGGERIGTDVKQRLFNELFMCKKKVTRKNVVEYLVKWNLCSKKDAEEMTGIDTEIKSSLSSANAFKKLIEGGILTKDEVEDIINYRTFVEDKDLYKKWLRETCGDKLSDDDFSYVSKQSFKDFGRLSKKLLCGIKGSMVDVNTGELTGKENTVIGFMWESSVNLSELLLSDKYTFRKEIEKANKEYYQDRPHTLDERLQEMYISNAVKRPIIRTLEDVAETVKAVGHAPKKIFVEMARGENKVKMRTESRKTQLLNLYKSIQDSGLAEYRNKMQPILEKESESRLQSKKFFLYYSQLGRCMYTGKSIDDGVLMQGSDIYNIDHIYPQSKVDDDSLMNNKVLVLSKVNGEKDDIYPIKPEIREKMRGFWELLHKNGLINDEKYKRLIRYKPFTEDEEWGFINRQLVETRQSTKAVAALLKERYPETEIVYVKAGIVSEFRHEYDLLKSRSLNDLHHAKDAYLNIVMGNVYHEQFTKQWYLKHKNNYSLKMKTRLCGTIKDGNGNAVWYGTEDKAQPSSIAAVKKTVLKNNCHMVFYSTKKKGGFFEQNIKSRRSGEGTVRIKKDLPVDDYGGYGGLTTAFTVLVKYKDAKKKTAAEFVPIPHLDDKKYFERPLDYIKSRLDENVSDIELPLGTRPIKIGTEFSLDGLHVILGGQGYVKPSLMSMKVFTPLILSESDTKYVKKVESFVKKTGDNSNPEDSSRESVNKEGNIALFDKLVKKHSDKPYCYRPEKQLDKIKESRDKFAKMKIKEQCKCLLSFISMFNRTALTDKDLGNTNNCRLSASLKNWKYSDVRIIDRSPAGLFEKCSVNLKELL